MSDLLDRLEDSDIWLTGKQADCDLLREAINRIKEMEGMLRLRPADMERQISALKEVVKGYERDLEDSDHG